MAKKGRFSDSAAREFEAQLGVGPGRWHCRWNTEAPVRGEPVIPGRYGELYPFGSGELGVYVRGPTAYRVRKIRREHPNWVLIVEGDTEAIFVAPITAIDVGAMAVRAFRRSRPRLSAAEKLRRVERMAAGRNKRRLSSLSADAPDRHKRDSTSPDRVTRSSSDITRADRRSAAVAQETASASSGERFSSEGRTVPAQLHLDLSARVAPVVLAARAVGAPAGRVLSSDPAGVPS